MERRKNAGATREEETEERAGGGTAGRRKDGRKGEHRAWSQASEETGARESRRMDKLIEWWGGREREPSFPFPSRFAHGLTSQLDVMSIVDETIEDRISDGGIGDAGMPEGFEG